MQSWTTIRSTRCRTPEIFDHVNEMDPATLSAIGEAWKAIAGRVEAGIGKFRSDVNGAITEGWQGRGGSAALEAVLAYSADAGELKVRVDLISNKIEEAKIALHEAKRSIPAPDGASTVEMILSMVPGATWKQAQYEAEEAERQARQVMKDVYLPYMKRADDQVPILPGRSIRSPAVEGMAVEGLGRRIRWRRFRRREHVGFGERTRRAIYIGWRSWWRRGRWKLRRCKPGRRRFRSEPIRHRFRTW